VAKRIAMLFRLATLPPSRGRQLDQDGNNRRGL